ncbi:MAG: hypothetical protein IKH51_06890 [Clostridia bacterium]|nr:hypothetical protein [Clostridia bacterium]
MKKIVSVILCAIFALAAFAGCQTNVSDETTSGPDPEATETTEITEPVETVDVSFEIEDDIAEKKNDFTGETLTILANAGFWPADDIYREEDSDDPVSSAIFTRNNRLEETYGYKINVINDANANVTIQNAFKSGIKDYDVAVYCASEACPAAATNIFMDLTTVPTLDLGKHYWDQGLFDGLSIDGKLFYITGDISTKANQGTFLCMFNKKVAADHDIANLYDMVRNGTWTIDAMYSICKEIGYSDDGNSKVGVEDFYPIALQYEIYLALYYGQGGHIARKDSDNLPMLDLNTEKNMSVIDNIYKMTCTDNLAIDAHDHLDFANANGIFASTAAFKDDRALFYFTNAGNIPGLRDMNSDFGVLPNPKYDENQRDYASYVYHGVALYMIPVMASSRSEFIGFALETMAYESHKTLTPAYYDVTLLSKSQRDADSYEMMDIAFRNRVWDLGYFAKWGGIDDRLTTQIKKGTKSFAGFCKSAEKSAQKALDKYINAYKNVSD